MSTTDTASPDHPTITVNLFRISSLARFKRTAIWLCVLLPVLSMLAMAAPFPQLAMRLAAQRWGLILLGASPMVAVWCASLLDQVRSRAVPARLSPRSLSVSRVDRRGRTIETIPSPDGVIEASVHHERWMAERWMAFPSSDARPSDLIVLADSRDAERLTSSFARLSRGTFVFRVVRFWGGGTWFSMVAWLAPLLLAISIVAQGYSYVNYCLAPLFLVSLPLAWIAFYSWIRLYEELAIGEHMMGLRSKGRLSFSDPWQAAIVNDALHVFPEGHPEEAEARGFRVHPDSSTPRAALVLVAELINERTRRTRQRVQRERDHEKEQEQGPYRAGGEE
jgi:hypothetical protein